MEEFAMPINDMCLRSSKTPTDSKNKIRFFSGFHVSERIHSLVEAYNRMEEFEMPRNDMRLRSTETPTESKNENEFFSDFHFLKKSLPEAYNRMEEFEMPRNDMRLRSTETPTESKNENGFFFDVVKIKNDLDFKEISIPNNSKQKENGFISTCGRNKYIKNSTTYSTFNIISKIKIPLILFFLLMFNGAVSAYETTSVGMVCSETSDCTKYCGGHVICSLRQCNCVNGSLFDEDNYGCFKSIHDLHGQECCYDEDCRISGAICREETKRRNVYKTCQCPEDHIFVENRCVQIKEKCSSKDDCEKHAHCVKLHDSINLGVCKCNHGYIYTNGSCVKPLEVLQECVDETGPFCKTNEIYCKSERHNYGACKYDYKNKKSFFGEMCLTTEECLAEDQFSICKHGFCDCMPGYKNESGKCHPNLIGLPCSSKHKCLIPDTKCDHEKKVCVCKNDSLFDGENCRSKNKEKRHCQEPDETVIPQLGNELKPKSNIAHNNLEDRMQISAFAPFSNSATKLSTTSIFISFLTCFWIIVK